MIIPYQHRYRGPYEYDKHVLNAGQLHNAVVMAKAEINAGGEGSLSALAEEIKEQLAEASERNQAITLNWLSAE